MSDDVVTLRAGLPAELHTFMELTKQDAVDRLFVQDAIEYWGQNPVISPILTEMLSHLNELEFATHRMLNCWCRGYDISAILPEVPDYRRRRFSRLVELSNQLDEAVADLIRQQA